MSHVGRKPSFEQIRIDELVVKQASDITTSGTITALSVSNISLVRLTAATVLQGITAPITPATNGKKITIVNANTVDLTIQNESTSATAANRIVTGISRSLVVSSNASVTLFYNSTTSRWNVESTSAEIDVDRLKVYTERVTLNSQDITLSSTQKSSIVEINVGSQSTVRSIPAGKNGDVLVLINKTGSLLQIANEDATPTAANRILTGTGAAITISNNASISLVYLTDNTSTSRWNVVGGTDSIDRLKVATQSVAAAQDLTLTSFPKASLIEITGAAAVIRSITAGSNGNLLVLANKTSGTLQFVNEDATPSAANRIITGINGPISVPQNASILLAYLTDSSSNSRWNVVGGTGASSGSVIEQVSQTGIGVLANYPIGTPLYVTATGWNKANASLVNTAEVAGLVSRRLNDDLTEVSLSGEISGVTASAFTEAALPTRGSVVFLSTTDGKLTISDITTIGYVSKPLGIVHNVNGTTSVDIMFYNQRGAVVGATNARTQLALSGSASSSASTYILNIGAYQAGEISGWININATTDYNFYFEANFAKNAAGSYVLSAVSTTGDTPPAGFSITVSGAWIQVTLPALAGFVNSYANYALNAPALGTSFPLNINSSSVYANYKTISTLYTVSDSDSLILATGSSGYTVTLPSAVGITGKTYTFKSELTGGSALIIQTTGGEFIDFATTTAIYNSEYVTVISNGTKWLKITPPFAGSGNPGLVSTGAQSFSGDKTFVGNISVAGVPLNSLLTPIGSIIAYNPGYYTNTTNGGFTFVGPTANTVAAVNAYLPAQWRVCDGTALNDSGSPIWVGANRYLPNLTDSRFLMGSTVAGTVGGAASTVLTTANLPSHTHNNTLSNATVASSTHTHDMKHTHQVAYNDAGQIRMNTARSITSDLWTSTGSAIFFSGQTATTGSGNYLGPNTTTTGSSYYTSKALDNGSVDKNDTGAPSATTTVTITNVSAGSASPTAVDILPTYLTAFYIVRVK